MEMAIDLCGNCIHYPTCLLRNGHSVMECEEHQISDIQNMVNIKNTIEAEEKVSSNHFKGLCQNCDLRAHCTWFLEDRIVFNCEHYQ